MKKILFTLLFAIALTSCSNNDGATALTTNGTRLLKRVSEFPDADDFNGAYSYSGDKLIWEKSNYGNTKYIYSGNLITKKIVYGDSGTVEWVYSYDSQDRVSYVGLSDGTSQTITYNDDGTVTVQGENADGTPHFILTLSYFEGEIVQKLVVEENAGVVHEYSVSYAYDGMNYPMDTPGMDKISVAVGSGTAVLPNHHNLIWESFSDSSVSSEYNINITYNDYGYPVTATQLTSTAIQPLTFTNTFTKSHKCGFQRLFRQ